MKTVFNCCGSKRIQGFTLIELSIVLVIIGLLVGGVMLGLDMMRQQQLRAVLSDVDRYTKAVKLFQDKYYALPGDFARASSYWSGSAGGDGDGQITIQGDLAQTGTHYEQFLAWKHLVNAGLAEGNFTGVTASGGTQVYVRGTNAPSAPIDRGLYSIKTINRLIPAGFPAQLGVHITVRGIDSAMGVLTPAEAFDMDTKLDDGIPGSGKVLSLRNGLTPGCLTTDDPATAGYVIGTSSRSCALVFMLGY